MTEDIQKAQDYIRFLRSLRAVRQFRSEPIPQAILNNLLEVARWSGSASNRQPWEFVVVQNRETLQALSKVEGYASHLANAPLGIILVMAGEPERGEQESYDEGRLSERRHRQDGHRLDLLHREARGDVLQRHRCDQLLVKHVVAWHVGDDHAQHVIDVARHPIKLHHLGHRADGVGEFSKPGLGMVGAFDRHKDRNTKPDLVLVDQRDPAQDYPVGFQPLDALPARRRRQSHPVADLGDGQRSIFLKHRQNLAVDGVEAPVRLVDLNGEVGHGKNFVPFTGLINHIYRKFF